MLIVSLIISTTLSALGDWLSIKYSDSFFMVLLVVNFIISISFLTLLFALMFKFLPDIKMKWRHVWIGSLVTAILFEIGKLGLGLYFGTAHPGTGYGAAGSIILILLWVSYSSMIVLYGAEFTHAYAGIYSGKAPPSKITSCA
jgi:membrane protein